MTRLLILLFALTLPLAACGPQETDPDPDGTAELPDPDPSDPPGDVDPLSRDDGQTSDDDINEGAPETGDDLFNAPIEDATPPVDEPEM